MAASKKSAGGRRTAEARKKPTAAATATKKGRSVSRLGQEAAKAPTASKRGARSPSRTEPAQESLLGRRAPAWSALGREGKPLTSKDLLGEPHVLYFYPRDSTPGCTLEAREFQAALADFEELGIRVLGVSGDSEASHQRFSSKQGLSFLLLTDPQQAAARAWGVWGRKVLYGKESMGIVRSTFVVDAKGVVRGVWRGVKVKGHVAQVLEHCRAL